MKITRFVAFVRSRTMLEACERVFATKSKPCFHSSCTRNSTTVCLTPFGEQLFGCFAVSLRARQIFLVHPCGFLCSTSETRHGGQKMSSHTSDPSASGIEHHKHQRQEWSGSVQSVTYGSEGCCVMRPFVVVCRPLEQRGDAPLNSKESAKYHKGEPLMIAAGQKILAHH